MLARLRTVDRSLLIVLLLALLVVPIRSAYIASVHSESIDDEYHLVRGLRFLTGTIGRTPLNDPVLGAAVMSLPLWLVGAEPGGDRRFGLVLHGQRVGVEGLQMLVALWKSLLYVPFVAFAFAWVRRIYDERAAWAAAALLLIEPTISAHIAPAALDVLGFQMIVLACWCWWRYFERPAWGRLAIAAIVSSAAMLTKHTAIVVPAVAACYAIVWWIGRPTSEPWGPWARRQAIHIAAAVAIALVALVILSGGIQPTYRLAGVDGDSLFGRFMRENATPAGYYWRSLFEAMHHGGEGHPSWLLGQRNDSGHWAYYFIVAAYKLPVAIGFWLILGLASVAFVRPRFAEWALLVPAVLLGGLIVAGGINIGFRHAIPVLGLFLLLSTRWLLVEWRRLACGLAAVLLAVTAIDVARFGPDLISYINLSRRHVWTHVNDSNLDWGQGLKQVRTWIDDRPRRLRHREVWVRAFSYDHAKNVEYYLGGRAKRVRRNDPTPTSGLLIISPAFVVGIFESDPERFAFLRDREPIAIIGHGSNLVYDLDAIFGRKSTPR